MDGWINPLIERPADSVCCIGSSRYDKNAVFVSNHEKLDKTFKVFSQVLDNFTAKVQFYISFY